MFKGARMQTCAMVCLCVKYDTIPRINNKQIETDVAQNALIIGEGQGSQQGVMELGVLDDYSISGAELMWYRI